MVVNSRFLVFPWVRSKNLASSALALATRRLADDWERIGETAGKGKARKGVYVMPLCEGAQEILRGGREAAKPRAERGRSAASQRRFGRRWEALVTAATAVAAREDARWQQRRRVFDSPLIMLFVFRLVVAPHGQGYRTTLCELWERCGQAGIELPQDEPPAAATACEAREKLDEAAFKRLHREILAGSPEGIRRGIDSGCAAT